MVGRQSVGFLVGLLFAGFLLNPTVARGQCVGDCNADGIVVVSELITGVNIALGQQPVTNCMAFDGNESGAVEINELIGGVNNALGGCPAEGPADTFPTSLHATREGKNSFYRVENGGFETITGIGFDELGCRNCHAATLADGTPVDPETYEPSCADCHADLGNPSQGITDALCLGCHSRQGAERNLFSDVHRDELQFTCMSCHSPEEMHGDGEPDETLLDTVGPQCEDCHEDLPSNTAHSIHLDEVHCSSCHVQSVLSCYNCHFDSEVAGAGKRFFTPPRRDFKFLLNFRGKVYPATFQSLVYQGESFYTIAPYYAHSITREVNCSDCHNNAAIQEYNATGNITVTRYVDGSLEGPSGVIPIPPDWETALLFDFLDYTGDPSTPIGETDPELWQFLKTGADLQQMFRGAPLTEDQLQSLSLNVGG